jgi:hypothetical protein
MTSLQKDLQRLEMELDTTAREKVTPFLLLKGR